MSKSLKKIKFKPLLKNILHFTLYSIHALFFLYILIILLISPFLFSSSVQEIITINEIREIKLSDNSFFEKINEEDIALARENIISYYTHNSSLNSNYFSSIEIEHYKDVRDLYYFNLTISLILSLYLLSIVLYLIYIKKEFTFVVKVLKYCIYILIYIIPLFVFFEYFWVYIFHPFLFPQGGFAILKPQNISYYLFSHQFFLIVGGIIYLTLFVILFSLKFLINKLLKYIGEEG